MVCARPTLERIAEHKKYNIQNAVITVLTYVPIGGDFEYHAWNDPAINFPKTFRQLKFRIN
jgi:hypothetical protein